MKKVVVLTTGGTIASMKNQETGLLSSGAMLGEQLVAMGGYDLDFDVKVESVFQIPSNHMDFKLLLLLKTRIEEIFRSSDITGIVVTHGTDTMEETAYFLDLTIADDRPVIITGSQRGPNDVGTDAFTNIYHAILAAGDEQCRGMGTLQLFNERIFTARYVKKVHASNINGFASPGYGYVGIVDGKKVFIYQKPVLRKTYELKTDIPQVDIIKCYQGADDRLFQYAVESGARGIILEGGGRGHITPWMGRAISAITAKGIPVVVTTDCLEGEVAQVYDFAGSLYHSVQNGALKGKDYDSKKARIKLAVLLAAGITSPASLQNEF